jgi:capsular exopolysaccharide synthesis family protein
MTPIYRATATIVVEGENPSLGAQEPAILSGTGFQIFENYIDTQMALIKSRAVAEKVFDEFSLLTSKRYKDKKDPFEAFLKDVDAKRERGTRVILISVDNPDPVLGADLANRLAETYAENNLSRRALSFVQNQRTAALNADYLRLQGELDHFSNKYGPNHPKMIELKREINAIASRVDQPELARFSGALQEGVSSSQTSPEGVLIKMQEGSVLASSRLHNIIIQDRAKVPSEIFRPKKIANILLGMVLGLLGGAFLAFSVDRLDDTVRTEEDVKNHIGDIPFLGSIPLAREVRNHKDQESKIDHLVALEPASSSAEAFRLIRTGVLWFSNKEEQVKDIAVVSPGALEGKTTVASNLAIALAQLGKKTLLVDADIRKGRLHESYGLPGVQGLGEYLMGEVSLNEIIQETDIPNLSIVCCGKSAVDPSRLLSSPPMSTFTVEMRRRFDFIVYDTPPLTFVSDASILISQLSAVVLDLRSGVTHHRTIEKALELIKASHTRLIGAVLDATRSREWSNYNRYYRRPSPTPATA